ncbi:tumor necrosis factor ligand superfamily member 14 [Chiroxiphia lanceolata]|uniref:tumor necrosis factor ligand superfamily member 14 n=1 Tax=Chiroxiphia lanceolata TaxID=296741 RepID=UPI0013CE5CF1|nr:tumor necrosis factor ligand superfamily member 14 [Chiroxiphia lanceolata]
MGDGVFALAGPWPPVPPPRAAATPPVPSRRRWRGRGAGTCGRWVLGTLVALALVALAVQGWVLVGLRGDLDRVTERLQETGADLSSQPNGSLRWESRNSWAFLRGLGYRGGSLLCRRPGLYFVYAQVHLSSPELRSCAHALLRIRKRSPHYPEPLDLLLNKGVHCPPPAPRGGGPWARSSFFGGLVELEEGDEVFAQVQEPRLVRALDGTRSYFGMFMV